MGQMSDWDDRRPASARPVLSPASRAALAKVRTAQQAAPRR